MVRRISGFTMIEVLLAMLVLGSGALAMVMLQLQALRSSRDSALLSRAMIMAVELTELRAEYRASGVVADPDPYLFSFSTGATRSTPGWCTGTPCSRPQFADSAIAGWATRLSINFPGAYATVCRDSRAPAIVSSNWACVGDATAPVYIKLRWRGARHFGADGSSSSSSSSGSNALDRPQLTLFVGY